MASPVSWPIYRANGPKLQRIPDFAFELDPALFTWEKGPEKAQPQPRSRLVHYVPLGGFFEFP